MNVKLIFLSSALSFMCASCLTEPESIRGTTTTGGGAIALGNSSGSGSVSSAPMAPPVELDLDNDLPGDLETTYAMESSETPPETVEGEVAVFAVVNRKTCNRLQKVFQQKGIKLDFERAYFNPNPNSNLPFLCIFRGSDAGKVKLSWDLGKGFMVMLERNRMFDMWKEVRFIYDAIPK